VLGYIENSKVEPKENEPKDDEQRTEIKYKNEGSQDASSYVQCDEETPPEQKFCQSLNSILDTATPEVLARLSNEEIFVAHKNLTELMSRVVTALQEKWQAPH
jgi:hypothetical protein